VRDRSISRDAFEELLKAQRKLERRVGRIENQHSPTVPIYDPDFPDDAVDGQFALASTPPEDLEEQSDAVPYFRWDNAWHPFVALAGSGSGIFKYIAISGRATVPTGPGASPSFPLPFDLVNTPAYDATLFEPVFPYGLRLLQKGLYWLRLQMRWAVGWGPVGVQFKLHASGGETAIGDFIQGWDGGGIQQEKRSFYFGNDPGFGLSFVLVNEGLYKVTNLGNSGGPAYRTEVILDPANPSQETGFSMAAMKLSNSGWEDQGQR
jgi:hypothetical protein